jgi:hypothetical protein
MPNSVILFLSIHHVLAAEKVFKEHGLWLDVVPVPRGLSSECGMAIEFHSDDLARVGRLLQACQIKVRGVFRPCVDGYREVRG